MAKAPKLPLPSPPTKRRGRPPKPGGPIPAAESQRAYRARLKAAAPAFDPATQVILDRDVFVDMREQLHAALLKSERREQDVTRLEARNTYLESELKHVEHHNTNVLKEVITLRQALARQGTGKPR